MVTIKLEGVEQAMKMFDPKKVEAAARSAVNDVADYGKAEASRVIREEYNVKARRLSEFLKVSSRAKGDKIEAIITGKGLGLPLAYFDPKQENVKTSDKHKVFKFISLEAGFRRGGAVTAIVKKTSGRKVVTEKPPAFMAQMRSGHIGVFQRIGDKRKPIKVVFGPGVGGLFGSAKIMDRVVKYINSKFAGRFDFWLRRKIGSL